MLSAVDADEKKKTEVLNDYLLYSFGYSKAPSYQNLLIESELKKYKWHLDEHIQGTDVITPAVLGSVIEKVVNQRETGAYYTPNDTTHYIAKYTILFSLLCSCELHDLAFDFFNIYQKTNNVDILNSTEDPISNLAIAINELPIDRKEIVFNTICNFTVLDPTCGTGAFIVAAADILLALFDAINMQRFMTREQFCINMFQNCLYGVDIEPVAISLIHLRAKIYLLHKGISTEKIDSLKLHFFCGDALQSTNSFSWDRDLKQVRHRGGFDCIIGNPPYVEQRKTQYTSDDLANYSTLSCGNLFAYVVEKSIHLLKENSYMGMIVPISLVSTQRMNPLRKLLFDNGESVYFSNFSDRPSCLFTGVHQKLTIFFFKKTSSSKCRVYTSTYLHWNKNERSSLFGRVKYQLTPKSQITEDGIAKIGDETKFGILEKVSLLPFSIKEYIAQSSSSTGNDIYLNQRMTFWAKCFSMPEPSNEYKTYSVDKRCKNKSFAALLNSSLFYLLWETYSDCWHITRKDLYFLRIGEEFLKSKNQELLSNLQDDLEKKLKQTRKYVYTKQTDYIYIHRLCKNEIEKIDDAISLIFGFSDAERKYIKEYNIKYRLSQTKSAEEI